MVASVCCSSLTYSTVTVHPLAASTCRTCCSSKSLLVGTYQTVTTWEWLCTSASRKVCSLLLRDSRLMPAVTYAFMRTRDAEHCNFKESATCHCR